MSAASSEKTFRVAEDRAPSFFDRQERLPDWDQARIAGARCLVVGAGAIGNELIKNLALLGFSKLTVCDFDTIENTNLSRTALFSPADVGQPKAEVAARRFQEIALADRPVAKAFTGDIVYELGTGVYARFDLVFGCLDNVEARIAVNAACRKMGVPWIDAGIRGLSGHVALYGTGDTPCLQCGLSRNQWLNARARYSCDNVKKAAYTSQVVATVQVTSALVAALQAQEALKLLFGDTGNLGRKMIFDGRRCDFDLISLAYDRACLAHGDVTGVREVELATDLPLGAFLDEVGARLGFGREAILDLSGDRSFVRAADCRGCGTTIPLMKPNFRIAEPELFCAACRADRGRAAAGLAEGQPTRMEEIAEFSRSRTPPDVLALPLDAIGIPPGHLLHLRDGEADQHGVHVSPVAGLEPFVP